jgi:nicotinate dehydrogenase subunit A
MTQRFTLNVNGKVHSVDADPDMPLLYALRNDIGINNPHFGCGLAQCGACTVHLDGQAIRSCVTPVSAVGNGKVVTLAGLGTPEKPHPLQKAYVEEQVPQCGYCINGWIMTAAAFLATTKKPSEAEIKQALEGLWSSSAVPGSEKAAGEFALSCAACDTFGARNGLAGLDLGAVVDRMFMVMLQDFMDPWTFNQKNLMKCCKEILLPDGKQVPFCAYNSVGYREQVRAALAATSP